MQLAVTCLAFYMVLCALALIIGGPAGPQRLHRPLLKMVGYLLRLSCMTVFNLLSLLLRLIFSCRSPDKIAEAFAHFTERTADAFFPQGGHR